MGTVGIEIGGEEPQPCGLITDVSRGEVEVLYPDSPLFMAVRQTPGKKKMGEYLYRDYYKQVSVG